MPWKETNTMSLRREFVSFASQPGANIRELCRRFGISPTTGYKWLQRFREEGDSGLRDRSRRPESSPRRCPHAIEKIVVDLRDLHPMWGGRKISKRLRDLHVPGIPVPSTVTNILRRHGRLSEERARTTPFQRFERGKPNELWQMDFKGDFPLQAGRCYPLTILDDHSRFSLAVRSCSDQQRGTVRGHLESVFRRYGLPEGILTDNGPPWRAVGNVGLTRLAAWLVQLGIRLHHSRPRHPQTLGKEERFHRSLNAEVIQRYRPNDHEQCQLVFDAWREVYNSERPHEALDLEVPASRYRPSPRPFPESLPQMVFGPDDLVRKVDVVGRISYRNRPFRVSRALAGKLVALRPSTTDGVLEVFYFHHRVVKLDVRRA